MQFEQEMNIKTLTLRNISQELNWASFQTQQQVQIGRPLPIEATPANIFMESGSISDNENKKIGYLNWEYMKGRFKDIVPGFGQSQYTFHWQFLHSVR